MDANVRKIFAHNLNYFLNLNEKKQIDLAKHMGVSGGLVSSWCRGEKMPRVNKIKEICDWFNIEMTDMLTDKTKEQEEGVYFPEEVRRIAEAIRKNPDLTVLTEICADLPPDQIKLLCNFVRSMKESQK